MKPPTLKLPATPAWLAQQNREALEAGAARDARRVELDRTNNQCERCDFIAWSYPKEAQLEIRPKEAFGNQKAEGSWVLCPKCAAVYDKKRRQRAS